MTPTHRDRIETPDLLATILVGYIRLTAIFRDSVTTRPAISRAGAFLLMSGSI
jgi:hypothetical protein